MANPLTSLANGRMGQNDSYKSNYADGINFNVASNAQPIDNGMFNVGAPQVGTQDNYGMPQFGMPQQQPQGDSLANSLGGYADVALAGTGLLNTYLGFKDAKMQKQGMGASLAFQNQANANNAKITNAQLDMNTKMAAQGFGHQPGSEGFNKYIADNQVQVDGSAVRM
jgi:hypothetical protein